MKTPRVNVVRPPTGGYTCPRCGGAMGKAVGVKMIMVNVDGEAVLICDECDARIRKIDQERRWAGH